MRLPLTRATDALESIARCLTAICKANGIDVAAPVKPPRRSTGLEGLADLDEDQLETLSKQLDEEGYRDEDEADNEPEGSTSIWSAFSGKR